MSLQAEHKQILDQVAGIVAEFSGHEGPLLPILHAVQGEFGHIPEAALPAIASALNLSRAEVHGVVSFYHDFRDVPAGEKVLKICRAEACQAMGGEALSAALLQALGVEWHGTTQDGSVTVEPVYCLGLCSCAPAVMLNDELIGRATPDGVLSAIGEADQ